jgi:hypothetical protein
MVVHVGKQHSVLADQVVPVLFVNWTAPCQINVPLMRLQADLVAEAMVHKDSLGLVLMPQFAYRPSELWLQEQMVMQMLADRGISAYRKWALMFRERVDLLDTRSLAYDGKLLTAENLDMNGYLWQNCKVMQGRTELATQIAAMAMVQMEGFQENALLKSTDIREGNVEGAAKVSQLGEDAMQKVLDAVMEGPDWGTQPGKLVVLIVDVNPGVGNLLDAYMSCKSGMQMPMHYLAIADGDLHQDWLHQVKVDAMRQKHYNGEVAMPGRPQPSKEIPMYLLDMLPTAPTLSKLAMKVDSEGSSSKLQLLIPKVLMDTWGLHEMFKDRFHNKIQEMRDDLGDLIATDGVHSEPEASPLMRRAGDDMVNAPKRPRVMPNKIINQESMVGGGGGVPCSISVSSRALALTARMSFSSSSINTRSTLSTPGAKMLSCRRASWWLALVQAHSSSRSRSRM